MRKNILILEEGKFLQEGMLDNSSHHLQVILLPNYYLYWFKRVYCETSRQFGNFAYIVLLYADLAIVVTVNQLY